MMRRHMVAGVAFMLLAGRAYADSPPSTTFVEYVFAVTDAPPYASEFYDSEPIGVIASGTLKDGTYASAIVTTTAGGTARAEINSTSDTKLSHAKANAAIGSLFELYGPTDPFLKIPVSLHAFLETNASGYGYVASSVTINAPDGASTAFQEGLISYDKKLGFAGGPGFTNAVGYQSLTIDEIVDLSPNTLYSLAVQSFACVGSCTTVFGSIGPAGAGDAYGYADPSLTINGPFASHYKIYGGLLGPPIPAAPPPGVPEPTTWAMLISGFGIVGWTARRRRTVTTT